MLLISISLKKKIKINVELVAVVHYKMILVKLPVWFAPSKGDGSMCEKVAENSVLLFTTLLSRN